MAMIEKKKTPGKSNFFGDVKNELKKVNYPDVATVRKNTIIVIGLSIIVGLFIAALDFGFGKGATYLINNGGVGTQTQQQNGEDQLQLPEGYQWIQDEEGNVSGYIDAEGNVVNLSDLANEEAEDSDINAGNEGAE